MGANGTDLPGKAAKISSPKPYKPNVNGGGKPPPFWADWGANFNKQSKAVGEGASKWWADMGAQTKNWKGPKWEMPVHVDVDVLNPLIIGVKKNARDIWVRLPPPVQQGLPYVAVGATTGMLVWKIQGNRLRSEQLKGDKLQTRVEELLEQRQKLQKSVNELKTRAGAPRTASDMKMAAAVAEATQAAAAAASAAASAASRCSVIVRRSEK